ncbi:MAG: ABC transporter ATP-binding protein [Desulfobacterium sp.]|nr:ABC transporter ATP-binding protein [Desulfobacterium sp.]
MKIEFDKVSKSYLRSDGTRHLVFNDVSLSSNQGDFVIFLGESGCGKTTFLNMLAGFESPTTGTIRVDGKKVSDIHPSRTMLFQQPTLIPWLTVRENVSYGCRLRGDCERLNYRVTQFIEVMGLSGFEDAKPAELSLGMAQRACLARALMGQPEILIMDEPFASLDTFTKAHIQEEMVNLWLSEQFTVVFVTHDIEEATLLGNRVVLLGGNPAGIIDTFDIDLDYPRNVNDPKFKGYKQDILEKFKRSYVGNRRFL